MHGFRILFYLCCALLMQDINTASNCSLNQSSTENKKIQQVVLQVETITRSCKNGSFAMVNGATRKFDMKSNGQNTSIQKDVEARFSEALVCISVKETERLDHIVIKTQCHLKCLDITTKHEMSIILQRDRFSDTTNTSIVTTLKFSISRKALKCNFCIGYECEQELQEQADCMVGDNCYYMTLQDDENDADAFPKMGCTSDILFQRLETAECWNGCRSHVQYGAWDRYVCTFCCDTDACNNVSMKRQWQERQRVTAKATNIHTHNNILYAMYPSIVLSVVTLMQAKY